MKNLFRKNNIIIAALAIMIIIAGYLNFSSKNDPIKTGDTNDYDTMESTMGDDISDSDILSLDDQGNVLPESALDLSSTGDATKDQTADSSKDSATSKDTASTDSTKDTADNKDAANTVASDDKNTADTGKDTTQKADSKDDKETSTPGEAVLVSTTTTADYFASSRLKREQWRSKYEQNYNDIIINESVSEETKQIALNALLKLNKVKEAENASETLLEAKGFSDALVFMQDKRVDVVINAEKVTEQDLAQIMDIVKAETGMKATQIHVNPTIANE
ncbi:SpoIIIAH-like family protein [Anaerocolumna xylanovorans]|uniref:Stage III sporulation protein AH n=1 Tax=Anaerocolumna xylanovorans DSM 12503 TaxID=1121345 RepID=A0A1M7YIZ5_9FIRM|nr:SpoIIIAH-like family protein [Anaerocolumna xylanovorans]SHO52559.1 stage III sporulation protein AH [Anaerocolumna xylanovorans DSM 12503]